ncbi:ABC transporter permease [Actinophytocola sediminis]
MNTFATAVADSATMLRRNLRHTIRYPVTVLMSLGVPILLLLLFVGVFGGTLNAGLGDNAVGTGYLDYLVPGILLVTICYGSSSTALSVNRDMTEGIVDRFRTMAISRTSILTGHAVGAVIRSLVSIALVVGGALLMGYRPAAGPVDWLAATGILVLLALAMTWLAVAAGLAARTIESASMFNLVAQLLPFLSSAFVPTDSMSAAVRWFAEYMPFTPIINTLRGLLSGGQVGGDGLAAVAWGVGLSLAGYLWARAVFSREPVR